MTWYRLDLAAGVDVQLIKDLWRLQWEVSGGGPGFDCSIAVFRKSRPGSGQTLYFTPTAARLAVRFRARPCQKPSASGSTLLAGETRAWQIHYPDLFVRQQGLPLRGFGALPFQPTEPAAVDKAGHSSWLH